MYKSDVCSLDLLLCIVMFIQCVWRAEEVIRLFEEIASCNKLSPVNRKSLLCWTQTLGMGELQSLTVSRYVCMHLSGVCALCKYIKSIYIYAEYFLGTLYVHKVLCDV